MVRETKIVLAAIDGMKNIVRSGCIYIHKVQGEVQDKKLKRYPQGEYTFVKKTVKSNISSVLDQFG